LAAETRPGISRAGWWKVHTVGRSTIVPASQAIVEARSRWAWTTSQSDLRMTSARRLTAIGSPKRPACSEEAVSWASAGTPSIVPWDSGARTPTISNSKPAFGPNAASVASSRSAPPSANPSITVRTFTRSLPCSLHSSRPLL